MLKRILLALILMPFALESLASQLTATLQSGEKVTPFYGSDSFKEALSEAVDGDVITLSAGAFNTTEVTKGVTIIGTYAFSTDESTITKFDNMTVSADNVTLEGIRFTTSLEIKGANNLSVSRSFIAKVTDTEKDDEHKYHNNTIMTDCIIQVYNAMSLSTNTVLRNCGINCFTDTNSVSDIALIENCNVAIFSKYNDGFSYGQPYAIYNNCMLGLYLASYQNCTLNLNSPSEFHNNLFYISYYHSYLSTYKWTIEFNSCTNSGNESYGPIGSITSESSLARYDSKTSTTYNSKTYGPVDTKSYPSIPSITSATIDSKTDNDGILHVKITATARD